MFYSVGHVKLCEQIATYSSTPCNKHVYGIALTEENKLYCSKVRTALSSKQLFHSRERIYLKNLFQKWAVSVSYLEHALNFTSLATVLGKNSILLATDVFQNYKIHQFIIQAFQSSPIIFAGSKQ